LTDTVPFPDSVPAQPDPSEAEVPMDDAVVAYEGDADPAFADASETHSADPMEPDDDDAEPESEEPEAASGFAALGLSEPLLRAIAEKGYRDPTPIQAQATCSAWRRPAPARPPASPCR
jgi:hypothetical protein